MGACSEDAANGMMEGALSIRGQIPPVLQPAVAIFGKDAGVMLLHRCFLWQSLSQACLGHLLGKCIFSRKEAWV